MHFLLNVFKGALIGISVVIPGVSGGSMAMSMGIYQQIISALTLKKSERGAFRRLLPYVLGAALGIAVFAFFIEWFFSRYPFRTACVFVGMILGALPMLLKNVRGTPFRFSHAIILLTTVLIMIILPVASGRTQGALALTPTVWHALLAAGLGVIGAATMIVPGVSGSMLLMILGYYEPVLQSVNAFTSSLLSLSVPGLLESLIILGPFTVGAFFGMVVIARGIRLLLKRYPYATYYGIIGLVLASPFAVLYQQSYAGLDAAAWLVAVLLAAVGFIIAMLLGKGDSNQS